MKSALEGQSHIDRRTTAAVLPLLLQVWREHWRSLAGWSLALAVVCAIYLPFHASMSADMINAIKPLPQSVIKAIGYDRIGSGAGYAQATVFGLIGFVLATIAAVSWGTKAVAGDEEAGTLELTLAHGVTRRQVVLERALGLLTRLLVLGLVVFVMVLALNGPAKLDLPAGRVLAGVSALVALTGLIGLASLAAGAVTGRRSMALGCGAGLAVVAYMLNALGKQNPDWGWMLTVSPYGWAYQREPLVGGFDWSGLALLGLGWALCLGLALVVFDRRDVGC